MKRARERRALLTYASYVRDKRYDSGPHRRLWLEGADMVPYWPSPHERKPWAEWDKRIEIAESMAYDGAS